MTSHSNWKEAVRLCGFADSAVAKSLAQRARRGQKLTSKQVEWVYYYAGKMKDRIVDVENVIVKGVVESDFPLVVDNLFSRFTLVLRPKGYVVEISTERVIGIWRDNILTIYPNPLLSSSAVGAAVRRNGGGLRNVELVRQQGQDEGQSHPFSGGALHPPL